MKLNRVTITGIDERTDMFKVADLYDQYPFLECAILCSRSRNGKEPRYPKNTWVYPFLHHALRIPMAAHLCGSWAREAVGGPFLWLAERHDLFQRVQRIQINGQQHSAGLWDRLVTYQQRLDKEFLIQCANFPPMAMASNMEIHNPSYLLDASGGTGKAITEFPIPTPGYRCGYAGGIGPHNVRDVLTKLNAIKSDATYWIDMESGVRTDDWLDLLKVRQVLEIAKEFV